MIEALISGGILGSLGAIVTNILDLFKQRQINKQEVELKKLDLEAMDKEYQYRNRSAEIEADTELEKSADALVVASYQNDARAYSVGYKPSKIGRFALVLVDAIRGLVRPGLTVYLIYCVRDTRAEAQAILSQAGIAGLPPELALNVYREIVLMILFLAATAATWWFGSRQKARKN